MPSQDTCPCIPFAHFTANQAILEAFTGKKKVHVIDFSINQGAQWPALMQALALTPAGSPTFRLTGIGPANTDQLQEIGTKLGQLADTLDIEFEYRGFVTESLSDFKPTIVNSNDGEVVAVNSVFELNRLLDKHGALEKLLSAVKKLRPEILTVVEITGDGGRDGIPAASNLDLGKHTCDVVLCEGTDRVNRYPTLHQWKTRFESGGFEPVHLGSNNYRQASILLSLFGSEGYRVDEHDGCLMLFWHAQPLITVSAWKLR